MKVQVMVERTQCDYCSNVCDYGYQCRKCGKEACNNCESSHFITYHPSYSMGHGDLHYCNNCNAILINSGKDAFFNSYRNISLLKMESEAVHAVWKKRFELACKEADRLFDLEEKASSVGR